MSDSSYKSTFSNTDVYVPELPREDRIRLVIQALKDAEGSLSIRKIIK